MEPAGVEHGIDPVRIVREAVTAVVGREGCKQVSAVTVEIVAQYVATDAQIGPHPEQIDLRFVETPRPKGHDLQ